MLIADDHALVREGLALLLAQKGAMAVVGTAANGREAVNQAIRLKPHVALLDLNMPELNGFDAAREIRAKDDDVRVLVVTGRSSIEYLHRAFRAGAHGYLLKHATGAEAVSAVKTVHAGKRYVSPQLRDLTGDLEAIESAPSPLERLSARERQVLQLMTEGHSSTNIAQLSHLSPKSVDTYRSRIMRKLAVENLAALVKFALRHGITSEY